PVTSTMGRTSTSAAKLSPKQVKTLSPDPATTASSPGDVGSVTVTAVVAPAVATPVTCRGPPTSTVGSPPREGTASGRTAPGYSPVNSTPFAVVAIIPPDRGRV